MGMRVGHEAFHTGPGAHRHYDNLRSWIVGLINKANNRTYFVQKPVFNRTLIALVVVLTCRIEKYFCKQFCPQRFSSKPHRWTPSDKNKRNSIVNEGILLRYFDVKVDHTVKIVHLKYFRRFHKISNQTGSNNIIYRVILKHLRQLSIRDVPPGNTKTFEGFKDIQEVLFGRRNEVNATHPNDPVASNLKNQDFFVQIVI